MFIAPLSTLSDSSGVEGYVMPWNAMQRAYGGRGGQESSASAAAPAGASGDSWAVGVAVGQLVLVSLKWSWSL